jgi:hypothetical protein
MKKSLVAGVVVTTFGATQAIAAACVYVTHSYPWLLLLPLMPAALGVIAWITFRIFKSPLNVLGKISAFLGWGGLLVACLGGSCAYLLNSLHAIQIVSWGGFTWIVGAYITLAWARPSKKKQLGADSAESVEASTDPSQPQPDSAPNSRCRELLVVERWLCVIDELKQDSDESFGSEPESEQISHSISEAAKERRNPASSQRDVVVLMGGQLPNRRRTQSSSPPRDHHGLDRHLHRRTRCMRPALS